MHFIDPKARHPIDWNGTGGPNRYYVENTLEGVQQPGEWYLDRHAGELYYWPEGDITDAHVVAPVLNQLVRVEGDEEAQATVEYLAFRGLTFADADWTLPAEGYPDCGDVGDIVEPTAIAFHAARHCAFEDNCIKNVGNYALEVNGCGNLVDVLSARTLARGDVLINVGGAEFKLNLGGFGE